MMSEDVLKYPSETKKIDVPHNFKPLTKFHQSRNQSIHHTFAH